MNICNNSTGRVSQLAEETDLKSVKCEFESHRAYQHIKLRKTKINIFVLDPNPYKAASMHCDKHVVKMILETAQMLSTAHRVLDGKKIVIESYIDEYGIKHRKKTVWKLTGDIDNTLYAAAHTNHPSTKWIRESNNNYMWAWCLMRGLCLEYTKRYGKIHFTETKLLSILSNPPINIPIYYKTLQPLCMPDEYKCDDVVKSYRSFYIGAKKDFAVWKHSNQPDWWPY